MGWVKRLLLPEVEGFSNLSVSMKLVCLIFALQGVLRGSALTYGDSTLTTLSATRVLVYASYVALLIVLILTMRSIRITALALPPLLCWAVSTLDVWGSMKVQGILITAELLLFCMQKDEIRRMVFLLYRWFIFIMALVGIVCSISYALSLPIPYKIVDYYSSANAGLRYADYGVAYLYVNTWSTSFRLCALFNEPGYFGTIIALLLCADGFNFRNLQNVVLLVAGILSFSLAFFVLVAVGIVSTYARSPKAIVPAVFVGVVCLALLPRFISERDLSRFAGRIVGLYDGGGLAARSNAWIDYEFSTTLSGPHALWGNGGGYARSIAAGSSSFKNVIIDYGLCGAAVLLLLPLAAALGISEGRHRCILLALLFFLSIMQRPNINTLPYYIVLFGGIPHILNYYAKTERGDMLSEKTAAIARG